MALSKGIAYTTVVNGFTLLALTVGLAACGGIALSKLHESAASIGLWGIYFIIPSILSLVAGFGRYRKVFAVALSTHILGILVALGGMIYACVSWIIFSSTCKDRISSISNDDECLCKLNSVTYSYGVSCSTLKTIREVSAAATILYVFAFFVCCIGSILGCAGVCCRQRRDYRDKMMAPPPAYVLPYYEEGMEMATLEERPYHDRRDPYPADAKYYHDFEIEEKPYTRYKPYHDPYLEERPHVRDTQYLGPYIEERPRIRGKPYHGPHIEERPYTRDKPYHGPYLEERPQVRDTRYLGPYIEERPYIRDSPPYQSPAIEERRYIRAKPVKATTYRSNPLLAGVSNEVTDD